MSRFAPLCREAVNRALQESAAAAAAANAAAAAAAAASGRQQPAKAEGKAKPVLPRRLLRLLPLLSLLPGLPPLVRQAAIVAPVLQLAAI